jgi:hypothetical protein
MVLTLAASRWSLFSSFSAFFFADLLDAFAITSVVHYK